MVKIEQEKIVALPIAEYHEDMGDVLWWKFPIEEAPYVGSPYDFGCKVGLIVAGKGIVAETKVGGWPGYHTHFTPLPDASLIHAKEV